ncbi:hypothetical protein Taro_021987 [Colocasia esculenta]|uniref:Uncharacterized protein n=1 Tax=Colocasia esculenta TaxID=4460 RepID=A0A843V2P7_COLES|nr:hypothetical protein [Colocasia esculenta]
MSMAVSFSDAACRRRLRTGAAAARCCRRHPGGGGVFPAMGCSVGWKRRTVCNGSRARCMKTWDPTTNKRVRGTISSPTSVGRVRNQRKLETCSPKDGIPCLEFDEGHLLGSSKGVSTEHIHVWFQKGMQEQQSGGGAEDEQPDDAGLPTTGGAGRRGSCPCLAAPDPSRRSSTRFAGAGKRIQTPTSGFWPSTAGANASAWPLSSNEE